MISSIIQVLFLLLKFSPIWVSKERNQKESMVCLKTKSRQSFLVYCIQSKEEILSRKGFIRKRGSGELNKKRNGGFWTALATVIKKNLTTSIRKHDNELNVHKNAVRTAIKTRFKQRLTPLLTLYEAFSKQKKRNFPFKYWFTYDCYWGGME